MFLSIIYNTFNNNILHIIITYIHTIYTARLQSSIYIMVYSYIIYDNYFNNKHKDAHLSMLCGMHSSSA